MDADADKFEFDPLETEVQPPLETGTNWQMNGVAAICALFRRHNVEGKMVWSDQPEKFNGLWRLTTYGELKNADGTDSDENITALLKSMQRDGVVSFWFAMQAGIVLEHVWIEFYEDRYWELLYGANRMGKRYSDQFSAEE